MSELVKRLRETAKRRAAYEAGDVPWASNVSSEDLDAAASEIERLMNGGRTFWVVERFEGGKSAGYWNGSHSRDFTTDIDKAIQFCRRQDAMWTIVGWHWKDVQLTEHQMLGS